MNTIELNFSKEGNNHYNVLLIVLRLFIALFLFKFMTFSFRSPHVHMLLWLDQAPKYDASNPNSAHAVCSFIDKIISCSSKDVSQDLINLQTHKHSHTCLKRKGSTDECRFGIPYFPMDKTRILKPLPESYNEKQLIKLKKVLKKIKEALENEISKDFTFDNFLKSMKISKKVYIAAIRSSLTKPQIIIKRNPEDIFVSPYSIKIIELMRSNCNLQFVLDPFGAACYIIDYINKSSRGMSKIMRDVLQEIREGNDSLQQSLRKISNTFHNNSELSIQEACYNILQLQLSRSSEDCVFIPTFPLQNRVKLVKTQQILECMDETSTDIFEHGLIDHYCQRPDSLNSKTLAEFAANYRYSSIDGPRAIPLKDGSGFVYQRLKSRIIRYRNYHYELDPENFVREHLMLYYPWRNEKRDILEKDMERLFKVNEEKIKQIKKMFNSMSDHMLFAAFDEAMQRPDDDDENVSSPLGQQVFDFDTYSLNDQYSFADIEREFQDNNQKDSISFTSPQKLNDRDYQDLFERLNQDQRDYVMHVADHFESSHQQLFHFLTGGAGVGKSMVINTLYQTLFRLLNSDAHSNPDDPKILLCAPTGMASFNIGGQTLHSAFKLPLNQKELNELSASVSNTLSSKLQNLKVLIIDEISMVGQHTLDMIDKRLRHLLDSSKPFGGVSVIAVGDFFQLKAVCAKPLFYPTADNPYSEIFGQKLWNKFKVFQLTKIMRQNEQPFQVALNNLAKGKLTRADIRLFKTRTFPSLPAHENFDDAFHLFAKNDDVNDYNKIVLKKMKGRETICYASDIFDGHGSQLARRQLLHNVNNSKRHETMGIPKEISLKVGAKYMMTYNVDVEDGLCNGTTGTLQRIDFGTNSEGDKKPLRLWMKYDEPRVGSALRKKFAHYIKNFKIPHDWTPLEPIKLTIKRKKNSSLKINRKQYPLTLAHALTIHKSQGQSLKKVVVHIKKNLSRELLYVACSRATSLQGLYIVGSFKPPKPLPKNCFLSDEIRRWRKNKIIPKFKFLREQDTSPDIIYHNVQSLKRHINLVRNDENFTNSNILIFGETWTTPTDKIKIKNYNLVSRVDSGETRKPRGLAIYAKKSICNNIISTDSFSLKANKGCIDVSLLMLNNITVVGLYANPSTSIQLWNTLFKKLKCHFSKKCVIMGDVNMNSFKIKSHHNIMSILQKYNLTLLNKNTVTTHFNTSLDWVITNSPFMCGSYNSFFSHHYPIWIRQACHIS